MAQQSQLTHDAFVEGSWGVEIYEGLEPDIEKGDVVVSKHWCSRLVLLFLWTKTLVNPGMIIVHSKTQIWTIN